MCFRLALRCRQNRRLLLPQRRSLGQSSPSDPGKIASERLSENRNPVSVLSPEQSSAKDYANHTARFTRSAFPAPFSQAKEKTVSLLPVFLSLSLSLSVLLFAYKHRAECSRQCNCEIARAFRAKETCPINCTAPFPLPLRQDSHGLLSTV